MESIRKSLSKSLLLVVILVSSVAQPMKRQRENDEGSEQVAKMRKTAEQIKVREGYEGQTIKFKWSDAGDNDWIEVPAQEVLHSTTIKNMLIDFGVFTDKGLGDISSNAVIPLHNISKQTLQLVIQCLEKIHSADDAAQDIEVSDDTCSICWNGLHQKDETAVITTIACNHQFHKACLDPWIAQHKSCPACHQSALPEAMKTETITSEMRLQKHLSDLITSSCQNDPQALHDLLLAQDYFDIASLPDVCAKAWGALCLSGQVDNNVLKTLNDTLPICVRRLAAQGHVHHADITTWLLGIALPKEDQVTMLKGHTGSIISVCFNATGKMFASGSEDGTIRLWDVAACSYIMTLNGHAADVRSVCFSPDGTRLASGSFDNTIKIWDVATGRCIATLNDHAGKAHSVCFSSDGTKLASGHYSNVIKIWDITTNTCIGTLAGHTSNVLSVCWNSDGTKLASGTLDYKAKIWDVADCSCITTCYADGFVCSVCFSPDSTKLIVGSSDKNIKCWDAATGQCIATLKGHTASVYSVCFSPDGTMLASGSIDKTIKLWDVATGICITTLNGHDSWVNSVCFSPDKNMIASGSVDKTIKLWNIARLQSMDKFLKHEITIEQLMLLNLIKKTHATGDTLNLTEADEDNLAAIFATLPVDLKDVLQQENSKYNSGAWSRLTCGMNWLLSLFRKK